MHLWLIINKYLLCRFYFRNWHGLGEKEPVVTRYALRTGTGAEPVTAPLLEMTSLEYLFAQVIFTISKNVCTTLELIQNQTVH